MLIEIGWERLHPWPEFLRNELFQDFCERICCALSLVASCLVNQTDNAYTGKAACQ
jgi:hypothetical protein